MNTLDILILGKNLFFFSNLQSLFTNAFFKSTLLFLLHFKTLFQAPYLLKNLHFSQKNDVKLKL